MGGALESQMLALAEHLLLAWLTSPYVFPILPTWISTFTKIDPRILWSGEIAYLRHFQAHRLTEVCVSGCQTPCNSLVYQFDAIAFPNSKGSLICHVFILDKLRVLADLLSKRVPVWIFGILRGVNWQSYPKTIWNHWLSLVQRCPARISSWCRPLSKRNKFFRFQPPFGPYREEFFGIFRALWSLKLLRIPPHFLCNSKGMYCEYKASFISIQDLKFILFHAVRTSIFFASA